ncbi:hypothetical protein ACH5RR_013265 [Cinchona calisaya]|uniref:Uncharacterized protein n=1 Tax=Cinchona calisaya TaxID=153742 RepID=A0ABD3A013_9GENT
MGPMRGMVEGGNEKVRGYYDESSRPGGRPKRSEQLHSSSSGYGLRIHLKLHSEGLTGPKGKSGSSIADKR